LGLSDGYFFFTEEDDDFGLKESLLISASELKLLRIFLEESSNFLAPSFRSSLLKLRFTRGFSLLFSLLFMCLKFFTKILKIQMQEMAILRIYKTNEGISLQCKST